MGWIGARGCPTRDDVVTYSLKEKGEGRRGERTLT